MAKVWRLRAFIALSLRTYHNREDFVGQLIELSHELSHPTFGCRWPRYVNRLGLREQEENLHNREECHFKSPACFGIMKKMLRALESLSLFKNVDAHTLSLFASLFEPFSCPAGTVIFEQGDQAKYIYLLLSGKVEIRYKPYDGPPITITCLSKGHFFGWSAAIGNPAYTSGAVCKENCTAIRIRNADLYDFCAREPEAGCIILDLLAQSVSNRWQDAREQIQSLLNSRLSANGKRAASVKEEQ